MMLIDWLCKDKEKSGESRGPWSRDTRCVLQTASSNAHTDILWYRVSRLGRGVFDVNETHVSFRPLDDGLRVR